MHAAMFLRSRSEKAIPPVVVIHGPERHLKQKVRRRLIRQVLGDDEDAAATVFESRELDFARLNDELRTASMWGERRLVIVEAADTFISQHRKSLEAYAEHPSRAGVLVLDVASWPKNTRLARRVAAEGLEIECRPLTGPALSRWMSETAEQEHGKKLTREAAALLAELTGSNLGLVEQELQKLAAYVGDADRIGADAVRDVVGGWRTRTTWEMLDAVREGRPQRALECLDRLLEDGEAPQKILGGITFTVRKLAQAVQMTSRGVSLNQALRKAGVFSNQIAVSERYLRRLGRRRAEQLLDWLLEIDSGLKGGSRLSERVQLERLVIRLCGLPSPGRTTTPTASRGAAR